jgi:hypothetical protein
MSSDGNSTRPPAAADAAALALSRVVPGRACDTCTLCCKVIAVEDFAKPPGVWCRHCVRGKGCGIYETRPADCRTFFCEWMLSPSLGPEWKPERAKFALVIGEGGHLTAFVDPGFPGAWRASPYFEMLKRWSRDGARAAPPRIVTLRIGTRVIVLLPDREIDVGHVGPDESVRFVAGPGGQLDVRKIRRDESAAPR